MSVRGRAGRRSSTSRVRIAISSLLLHNSSGEVRRCRREDLIKAISELPLRHFPSRPPRMKLVLVLMSLCVVMAGCGGVPADTKPRAIEKERIPFDLLQPAQDTSSSSTPGLLTPVRVYMLLGDRLVPTQRAVVPPVQLGATLATLAQGPTEEEKASGITSKLKPPKATFTAQLVSGVAHINIDGAIDGLVKGDQIRAIAQVVFTATELEEVTAVQIESGSQPVSVPIGDGSKVTRPVQRADFATLAP